VALSGPELAVAETISKDLIKQFVTAVAKDQVRAVDMLEETPGLLNARCVHNGSVLHFLTNESCEDGVRFLAEQGADVNAFNKFGDSPLIDAATLGFENIVRLLLKHGANANAISSSYDTPIICAVRSGNSRIVDMLLGAGADPDYRSPTGKTIFDVLPRQTKLRLSIYRVLEKYAAKRKSWVS
jgi:ankyrin repeat protein